MLIASAIGKLSARELAAARNETATDVFGAELTAMFDQCEAVANARAPGESLLLLPHVAKKYLSLMGPTGLSRLPAWTRLSHVGLERRPVRRVTYLSVLHDALGPLPPGLYFDRFVSRARFKSLARVMAVGARSSYMLLIMAGAKANEWMVRRSVSRALEAVPLVSHRL